MTENKKITLASALEKSGDDMASEDLEIDDLSEDDATRLASDYGFTGGQIENISRI